MVGSFGSCGCANFTRREFACDDRGDECGRCMGLDDKNYCRSIRVSMGPSKRAGCDFKLGGGHDHYVLLARWIVGNGKYRCYLFYRHRWLAVSVHKLPSTTRNVSDGRIVDCFPRIRQSYLR